MNKSIKTKILSLFLAVVLSLPLGILSSLGIFAATESATTEGKASAPVEPTLTNTTDVAYFSYAGNNGNNGLSASAMKKYITPAWTLLPNGGTLVIPAKGYVDADTVLEAATAPIVITSKDPKTGTMYYTGDPATANSTQAGMIMLVALKTLTFKSDVIFQDVAILQRSCSNIANAANYLVTNGATMVIGDNVEFLYSTTVNKAVCNSKLTVDAGAKLIVKSAGALSYNGDGTIYVDRNLIGNGITADQFNGFTGQLYDLEGKPLCEITGHTYSLEVVDHKYYQVCTSCGDNGGAFTYTEPVVVSSDEYYWAYTGSDSNDGLSLSTPVSTTGKTVSVVNNGGTVYVVGKAHAGASVVMDMGGTTMFTAVGPDGTDYRGTDYRGEADAQYGAMMWNSSALTTLTFISDTIFKDINIYNRNSIANVLAVTNNSTAMFENVVLKTNSSSYPKNVLSIEAGSVVIMKGSNVGSFSKIIGKGTLVVDMQLVQNGKLTLAQLESFEGTVMTTECKEICAFTGGHDYVDNTCTICGAVAGTVINRYYIAGNATGDGSSADNPTNSLRKGFDVASADPIELILVDDLTIDGAIVCSDNTQDIKITSIDKDGDGVYPKLIINSYIVFDNAGYDNTITFENIEICSNREGTVPLFFCYNNFTIGEGVTCTLSGAYGTDVAFYPTIYAGYLDLQGTDTVEAKSQNADCEINVASGTWTALIGGNRRFNADKAIGYNTGNVVMNITGGHFIGESERGISLSGSGMNFYEGNIDVNISGGIFDKDIYAVYTIGGYGGATPYAGYGYKGDVSIDITGGELSGNIYAKFINPKLVALIRGSVSVTIGDGVIVNSTPMMVDLRTTQSYAGQYKVSSLNYSDMLGDLIEYKFVDVVNGSATNMGEPERIAFVGDSITQGTGASSVDIYSYPVQIQNMLNEDEYMVGNFGVGASGVLPSTRYWYNDTLQYHLLMEEFDPNTISFALGTNDANAMGGTAGTADHFEALYYELIKTYAELPTVDNIYIATPIMRFDHEQHQTRMISLTIPAIRRIAAKLKADLTSDTVTLVEMNAITFDDATAGNILGSDKLHPNDAGYTILAQAFYNAMFNGVVDIPSTFTYLDTVYISEYGTIEGSGTEDDPISDIGVAFSKINRAGGSIVILDEFSIDENINTPSDMTGTLTIAGYDPSCILAWTLDTIKLHSDVVFDNFILYTAGNYPYIVGQYHNVTFTDTFTTVCDGTIDVVFVAGYHVFGEQSLTDTSATSTYDTAQSSSASNDVTINISGGTFGAVILGNRRLSGTSVIGTYSGNLIANLNGGVISGRCQDTVTPSSALGMGYLTGNITVNFDGLDLQGIFYGMIRTGTLTNVTYDSSLNTGKIVINAVASTMENIVENMLQPGNALYAVIDDYTVNCKTVAGDIDENGYVTNSDITLMIRYLNGWNVTGAKYSGDMTGDGKVNNRDAIAMIAKLS